MNVNSMFIFPKKPTLRGVARRNTVDASGTGGTAWGQFPIGDVTSTDWTENL